MLLGLARTGALGGTTKHDQNMAVFQTVLRKERMVGFGFGRRLLDLMRVQLNYEWLLT